MKKGWKRTIAGGSVAASMMFASAPASALTIVLNTGNQPISAQALQGFNIASKYWESVLTNNVTVNLDVGFRSLGPEGSDILGQTGSSRYIDTISAFQAQIQATKSASGVDALASANLPTLVQGQFSDAFGVDSINMITPGYSGPRGSQTGIDTTRHIYDTDGSLNNTLMYMTTANAKALGFAPTATRDGSVTFNSDFDFDFNPTDGTDLGAINFLVVAIHEIGHALGFVSGVDDYDALGGPDGPCYVDPEPCGVAGINYPVNDDYWGSALDMFRYSSNPEGYGDGGPLLDWSIRNPLDDDFAQSYFSIDGGNTALFGGLMSRGQFNGASYQASHWRVVGANNGPGNPPQAYLGIMNPTGGPDNFVTALDIAAFDAIGWNSRIDALANPGYQRSTASIFSEFLPEPGTWMMMIAGFGMIGASMRRRNHNVKVTFAV